MEINNFLKQWALFQHNVVHKDRYFNKDSMFEKISRLCEMRVCDTKSESLFYRARFIPEKKCTKFGNGPIYGYGNLESGPPPTSFATSGRANARYVSRFYVALHPYTALVESKPYLNDLVSIATYKSNKPLQLVDFCNRVALEKDEQAFLLTYIGLALSYPVRGDESEKEYIFSQVLVDYVKSQGYDGIIYSSFLHYGGKNIVLFDSKSCDFLESKVYQVGRIKYIVTPQYPRNGADIMPEIFI